MNLCQHCLHRRAIRLRQLCAICALHPSVEARYTPYQAVPLARNRHERLAPFTTKALPGSDAKIQVMCRRYQQGFQLFHPRDAR